MWDLESTTETYDSDRAFAPVGLGVLAFWMGALTLGLLAFLLSIYVARGSGGQIVDNNRVVITDDVKGLYAGIGLSVILLVVSILVGLLGRAAVLGKKKLGGLWKLSALGVPVIMTVLFFVAISMYH